MSERDDDKLVPAEEITKTDTARELIKGTRDESIKKASDDQDDDIVIYGGVRTMEARDLSAKVQFSTANLTWSLFDSLGEIDPGDED